MIPVSLSWVAEQVNGQLIAQHKQDLIIKGVSTDTRSILPTDLFLALQGPNFDGHKFVKQAEDKGAVGLILSRKVETRLPYILVADTTIALGLLGAAVKAKVAPKTVGITGSSGKTTVREMVAAILSHRGKVLATKGNLNNDLGVPMTLLRLEQQHEFAVIEMGANHLGEIAYTSNLVKPDVATIVNAAAAHLEGFGSLLGVARAKSEIFKGLSEKEGLAVVNADSQFADYWMGKLKYNNVQTFSASKQADVYSENIILGLDGCAQFELVTPIGRIAISLSLPGAHNVSNALVSASLALHVGATLEDVRDGLRTMPHVAGRLHVKQLTNQVKILDDTYNANVGSVNAAIDLLSSFAGIKILVLGDMAELGEKARYYHEKVGEYAKLKGIDKLYTLGVLSQSASDVFTDNGRHFSRLEQMVECINQQTMPEKCDISILVKGSRSARMELVVKALEESPLGKLERFRERMAC
ncbi:UDP-N-acetylmuramoyl-tripeptide--D-alanyl-D-alanine ligase [Paraglaciecola psychrophila]|uniref:UDP-N-acetylmuramoyl-tripeptide--D-alanyl-D-alanine ligase n=1 Tax=Paraglaciecola psychrophila 170 TaxID=1129794 RepID=K7A9S6_9ALTE|nr:UDP-N-acetylmuramoyl-tripeptide--D-alanyl-D-alanine ligase [Paraglaciecola psychrophila]AGH43024.1 UDP-N-acetylmuramoylalanyl-D-glutamyl-2, 6-diaminopimelate--D-alanyl-D-alanyl ligase [Paraglaciecola psychrophila 170]GAC39052.1 UDP-N-acetylmuramoylalanyl-D-glutamyl-2,6-diaminopimelate--D-alanyl-D-alanine ligase [Paraglaciecola psychrophila 170]